MNTNSVITRWIIAAMLLLAAPLTVGCGGSRSVSLQSRGYRLAATSFPNPLTKLLDFIIPSAVASPTHLTGIRLCVTQMKLEAEDGSAIRSGDSDLIETRLGWIDLGDGLSSKNWGALSIPAGTRLRRLSIGVRKDESLCGGGYSAILSHSGGTVNLTKDIELRFGFDGARSVSPGGAITVGLTNFVAELESARLAGELNDEQISSYLASYASGKEDFAQ